jgi:hypothetical protein
LRVDRLLGGWGIPKDSLAGRDRFAQCMETRRRQETKQTNWRGVERGWCLGDQAFREELLAQMKARRGDHYGPELREADEAQAQQLVRAELRRRHWPEREWARRRQGAAQKVAMAWRLRRETPITLDRRPLADGRLDLALQRMDSAATKGARVPIVLTDPHRVAMNRKTLCTIICAYLTVSCSSSKVAPNVQRELEGRKLSLVKEGTPRATVLSKLGPPSEIRTNIMQGPADQAFAFAYGARQPGQWAEYGIVFFDKSNRVIIAESPTRGYAIRAGAEVLSPRLDQPHAQSNILCRINAVSYDPSVPDEILQYRLSYSLVNLSQAPCDLNVRDPLQMNLVIEVYDEKKSLFFRKDYGLLGTRGAWGKPPDYAEVHLGPESTVSDDRVPIWLTLADFGRIPPGTYYVRVAFGLDDAHFSVSKAMRFEVPGAGRPTKGS